METNCNKYRIKITDSKFKCIEANEKQGEVFVYPDISDELQKLYIVKQGENVIYVGTTKQDIRKRLRGGLTAKGQHGYYGYKWKELDSVELLLWCFPCSNKDHVEAIEAVLVYFIREKTGKWPKYQMEIHFHGASESEMHIAKSILSRCLE